MGAARARDGRGLAVIRGHTRRAAGLSLAALALLPRVPRAQTEERWPDRPVRLIVPYAPGATNDLLGRIVAQRLGDDFGQPFVVENRSGAQAIVGTEAVARARPDGHTLLVGASGPVVFNPATSDKLPYETLRDFVPVSLLVSFPLVLFVGRDSPVRSAAELGGKLRGEDGKATYASSASSFQLATELFLQKVGARATMVSYRGSADSVNAVAAGEVGFGLLDTPPVAAALQGGRVHALAVTSPARHPALPDVPTTAEAGLPDLVVELFSGILAPAGTPEAVVRRLHAALVRAMAEPEVRQRMASLLLNPVANTPEQFRAIIEAEIKQWRGVANAAGIKLDR